MPKMFQCFVGYSDSKFDSMFYGFAEDIPNIDDITVQICPELQVQLVPGIRDF
jgi:hypothetical protein